MAATICIPQVLILGHQADKQNQSEPWRGSGSANVLLWFKADSENTEMDLKKILGTKRMWVLLRTYRLGSGPISGFLSAGCDAHAHTSLSRSHTHTHGSVRPPGDGSEPTAAHRPSGGSMTSISSRVT